MKSKKPKLAAGKPEYTPSLREVAALKKYVLRRATEAAPRVTVSNGEKGLRISPDHPDEGIGRLLLMESLGTEDYDFLDGLLGQLANASMQGRQADAPALNFMLSIVKGVKPRDHVEAMLAAQMASIHAATMTFARRLAHVETIEQQDAAERALNKLARTFATQMEALKRYRTGGQQTVTVQHVSVSDGGQAIVGNVTQAARETAPEQAAHSSPALTDARQTPMAIISEPEPMQVPSRRGRKNERSPT